MLNAMHKYNGLRWHGSKIVFIHAMKMFYIQTEHEIFEEHHFGTTSDYDIFSWNCLGGLDGESCC